MTTLAERYAQTLARIEANKASDAEVARLTGQTIAEFDADTTAPDYVLPVMPDHEQRTNRTGRQVCCKTCHNCGTRCVRVLDGELWCATCGAYR